MRRIASQAAQSSEPDVAGDLLRVVRLGWRDRPASPKQPQSMVRPRAQAEEMPMTKADHEQPATIAAGRVNRPSRSSSPSAISTTGSA